MRAVAAVAWSGVRQRWLALVGLAIVVALGLGAALAAYEVALRTQRAYPDYLREANVAEVVVNPSLGTQRAEELIAATPGVVGYRTDDLLSVTFDDGAPRTQFEVENGTARTQHDIRLNYTQVRMSTDGRYTDQDRPVVHEGRMMRADAPEAFLSREAAAAFGLSVGDEVALAFWVNSYNTPGIGPQPDDLVEPIGRSSATVVGIGVFPDEVLVDELYPRARVLLSPAAAGSFTCTLGTVEADDDRTIEELFVAIVPADCALSYRFFSLQVEGGDAGVAAVVDSLTTTFAEENTRLPETLREQDVGYVLIPSATRDQRERVERSIAPALTVLRSFALAAALSTVVVATLAALRLARRNQARTDTWRSLGMTRRERLLAVALPLAGAMLAGVVGALAIGEALSGLGPIASVGVLEPTTRFGLGVEVVRLVGGGALALLLAGVGLAAATSVRDEPRRPGGGRSLMTRVTQHVETSRGLGMRATTRGAGAAAVIVGSSLAVGVVVAGLVFTTSLDGLTNEPARYGWPYDAAATVGFGYGGGMVEEIGPSLDRAEVLDWGLANLGSVTIEGDSIATIAAREQFASIPLPVIEGRLPATAEEIAVGRQTAADLGIDVGERVTIASYFGEREAIVTGTVVLPSVGPFESDRAGPGTGALLSERFFAALVADAEIADGLEPGSFAATGLGSFVVIDLADGVDAADFFAGLGDDVQSWDRNAFGVLTYPDPVRPAAIADVVGMRRLPLLFGAFVAATMAIGYAISIAVATRARRRELAILGALGCAPRQLAASVRWHALSVAGIAVVIGAPLGIVAGRTLYRTFATDLGVIADDEIPLAGTAAVIAIAIAVGLLASAGPARAARRIPTASVLRVE